MIMFSINEYINSQRYSSLLLSSLCVSFYFCSVELLDQTKPGPQHFVTSNSSKIGILVHGWSLWRRSQISWKKHIWAQKSQKLRPKNCLTKPFPKFGIFQKWNRPPSNLGLRLGDSFLHLFSCIFILVKITCKSPYKNCREIARTKPCWSLKTGL